MLNLKINENHLTFRAVIQKNVGISLKIILKKIDDIFDHK